MPKHLTDLQRRFAEGRLVLPNVRPNSVRARDWTALVRHGGDRVPYRELAAELHVSETRVRDLATRAAAALRYPALADVPTEVRHLLTAGGYTTREAVAAASDVDLLRLKGTSTARLRAVRAVIPQAR